MVFEIKIKGLRFLKMMKDKENTEIIKTLEIVEEEQRVTQQGEISLSSPTIISRDANIPLFYINQRNYPFNIVYLRDS